MTPRSPSKLKWIPTDRDFAILADLGELGIMTTRMIHKRHWSEGTGVRACQERLSLFRQEGLMAERRLAVTERQGTKIEPHDLVGPNPTAFVLLPKGAEFLETHNGIVAKRVSRSEPSHATLLHRLFVVACRLAFDAGFGSHAPRWIHEQDCVPGVGLAESAEQRHVLYERFRLEDRFAWLRPDASCLIQIAEPNDSVRFVVAYWEIDRSTNSPEREFGKASGYDCLLRTKGYQRHWPELKEMEPDAVRVFYVCESQKRIDELSNVFRALSIARFYRFVIRSRLLTTPDPTVAIWQDVQGRKYSILRQPSP
ncbi:MAG TPA: replication-relaxation family protein [Planctomycetaceae bacterium]|nr:replication-relaxation family protein [Planctomycetaceae bacterium]